MKQITPTSRILKPLFIAVSMSLATISLTACGGSSSDGNGPTTPDESKSLANTSFMIKDSQTAAPLDKTAAYVSTTSAPISNEAGYVYLGRLDKRNGTAVNFVKKDYAKQYMLLPLASNPSLSNVMVQMLKLSPATTNNNSNILNKDNHTGVYTAPNGGSQLTLNYDDLLALDTKKTPTQNVSVYVSDISDDNIDVLAGNLIVTDSSKAVKPLTVYGATNVQLNQAYAPGDEKANDDLYGQLSLVNLGKATPIKIRANGTNLPATTTLYYYDGSEQQWATDGTLNLTTENGKQYYTGTTQHVGYLVAGQPATTLQTVTGTLKDGKGQVVANAQVLATTANGATIAFTDNNGNYKLNLPQTSNNQVVKLMAYQGVLSANGTSANPNLILNTAKDINSTTAKSNLTWTNTASNLDLNVIMPSGEVVYVNHLTSSDGSTKLTQANLQESLDMSRLFVGTYRVLVYNMGKNFNAGISQAGTMLNITTGNSTLNVTPKAEYTALDKEITQLPSPLNDNRSVAWYAADMKVNADCSVTLSEPDTSIYRRWLNATQFSTNVDIFNPASKPFMQIRLDNQAPSVDATGTYCQVK